MLNNDVEKGKIWKCTVKLFPVMREKKKHFETSVFLLWSTIKSTKYLKLLAPLNIVHVNGGWGFKREKLLFSPWSNYASGEV